MPTLVDLARARELAHAALASLEASRSRIDDLNVYPVPDGDTGTNLVLTARAVVDALDASQAPDAATLAAEVTRAALLGARGNSGVILSQIVRGVAGSLVGSAALDSSALPAAFRAASDAAYAAVGNPVEGTILTVARELADEAERARGETDAAAALRRVVARGEEAVARTPEQLEVLAQAGVVDAGGAGLLELVRGLAAGVAGEPQPGAPDGGAPARVPAIHLEPSRFRYCTSFVVEGSGLDRARLERELEPLGDSILVVGDVSALKVHVHTDEPDAALELGSRNGVVEGVEIADMREQAAQREARLARRAPRGEVEVVAVARGAGNRALLEGYGVSAVVEAGPDANVSTAEIVAAVDSVAADEVIVLPNDANVVLAAEQAAGLASKRVRVVPSRSLQAGLAASARFVAGGSGDENERVMREALAEAGTGAVTRAARDAELDGVQVRAGQWLGLVDERLAASGDDFTAVAVDVVDALLADGRTILTLVTGAEEPPPLAELLERVRVSHAGLETLDVHAGGQPHYSLLVLAE